MSICSIFNLLLGLKTISFYSRSAKTGLKSLRIEVGLELVGIFIYFIIDFDTYDYKDTISYSEGYPVNKHIFYIWSRVEFPGKNGFWANI